SSSRWARGVPSPSPSSPASGWPAPVLNLAFRMKTYSGPISDHFDGRHFFDPDGASPLFWEMLRWQFDGGRKRHKWPEWAPSPYLDKPPPRVDGNNVR